MPFKGSIVLGSQGGSQNVKNFPHLYSQVEPKVLLKYTDNHGNGMGKVPCKKQIM